MPNGPCSTGNLIGFNAMDGWIGGNIPHRSGGPPPTLLDRIVSFWNLDEATGATREDSVGSNDLLDINGVTQVVGNPGLAAGFAAASSQVLSVADNASLVLNGKDWTLAGWAYPDTAPAFACLATRGGAGLPMETRINGASTAFQFTNATGTADFGTPTLATWHFICVRWITAAGTYYCSVNAGVPATLVSSAVADTGGSRPFTLGARNGGSSLFWNGRMQGWGLWTSAPGQGGSLTDALVTQLYNAGSVLLYPFA